VFISYTNWYQLLYKIVLIISTFIALGVVLTIIDAIPDSAIEWMPEWLQIILGISVFFVTLAYAPLIYIKTILPFWIPSWMYVRFNLGVPINTSEGEQISFLFDGSMPNGRWYPLNGFRKIEKEFRREALFIFANQISRENGRRIPFPGYEPEQAHREKTEKAQDSHATQQERIEQIIRESHRILGITELPTNFDTVKKAYRRKIALYHPDKFAGEQPEVIKYAEETSKRLNVAYSILGKYYQNGV
jgi:DnaJ-domain-containing protein 1